MKRLLSKRKKVIISFMLTMLILSSMPMLEVSAAEEKTELKNTVLEPSNMMTLKQKSKELGKTNEIRALLYDCMIYMYPSSSGMHITFETDCAQRASIIGVKDIEIDQKVWYGWKTVATSSGGYATNSMSYLGSILYTNAIKGEEYRITCTHYADADEYTEVEGELEFIFTY